MPQPSSAGSRVALARASGPTPGIAEVLGYVNYGAAVLCLVMVIGCAAIRANNRRLNPSNPQGMLFGLLIEGGRLSSALGLADFLGDPSKEKDISLFMSPRFLDVFAPVAAMLHLLLAAIAFGLGWGLLRGRGWARGGQATLAIGMALAAPIALPTAGAAIAIVAAGAMALAMVGHRAKQDADAGSGRRPIGWWLVMLGLGVVLLVVGGAVTELGLIRGGIAVRHLFG